MRTFTKSVVSYTWATSLFGLQQMAYFLLPQTWLQTDRVAKSFERITKATTEELGSVTRSTFRVADNVQRGSIDLTFNLLTLGLLSRGNDGNNTSGLTSAPGSSTLSNFGGQAVSLLCQGLEVVGQTAGIVGQAMGGVLPGQDCGSCSSTQTGWGPVKPPAGG